MPKYNETLDHPREVPSQFATTPGLDMDKEIEALRAEIQTAWDAASPTGMDQLPAIAAARACDRPALAAAPRMTLPWRAARRARGCSSSALDHRVPRVHVAADGRDVRLHVPEPHARPGAAAVASSASTTTSGCVGDGQVWESLGVTFKFAALWLPVIVIVPFVARAGAQQPSHVRARALMRTLFFLPYVVPFVAGVLDLETRCSAETGWINDSLRFLGWSDPPDWLFDTTFDLPGPRAHGHLGHRCRDDHQSRRPARASRRSSTRRRGSTAPAALGAAPQRDASR